MTRRNWMIVTICVMVAIITGYVIGTVVSSWRTESRETQESAASAKAQRAGALAELAGETAIVIQQGERIEVQCEAAGTAPTPSPTDTSTPTRAPTATPVSDAYYVSPDGNDGNPGTEARPFRTIARGLRALAAGNTLYIRQGVYHEQTTIRTPRVRVAAYPGEQPVIDGRGTIPSGWGYLLTLAADYVTVEGLEVRNSASVGVGLTAQHGVVRDLYVHHSYDGGILATGPYNLIEGCETWWNSTKREYGGGSGYWSWGMSAVDTHDVTFRGNYVHANWGEGIGPFRCDNIVIEDNVVADNMAVNVYLNRIDGAVVQRNFVYGLRGSEIEQAGVRAPGIGLADEGTAELANLTIVNNVIHDTPNAGIYFWLDAAGSGLKNALVAHNTVSVPRSLALSIHNGSHSNARIINNIFAEGGASAYGAGLSFSHNLYLSTPGRTAGPGDVVGDPQFVGGTGTPQPEWYRLSASSPAVDVGTNAGVSEDHWKNPRSGTPDIGAHER